MRLRLYLTESLNPYHNLSVEQALLKGVNENEIILYLWRNEKTVVVGRNQNIFSEVDLDALKAIGGYPTRRLSGGGAVYHDAGNLNFTFIAQENHFDKARQTEVVLSAVRSLGFDAEKTGRNDLTIMGRKFSGQSFYRANTHLFHNGTVLISTDVAMMQRVLTPSMLKFVGKGVRSVRSRTVNLSELNSSITWQEVRHALIRSFEQEYGDKAMIMDEYSEEDLRGSIFYDINFIYNKVGAFTISKDVRRAEGNCTLHLYVEHDVIRNVQVFTDALDESCIANLDKEYSHLIGTPICHFEEDVFKTCSRKKTGNYYLPHNTEN